MWYCVIQNSFWVGQSFAGWFTSNTEAYWLVLFINDKPHNILRLSLLVINMEFVIPFTAPPIPISIWPWLGFWYWGGGGGGGGFPLFSGCLVLWWDLHVLASGSRLIYLKFWEIRSFVLLVYRLQFSGSSADCWKIHVLFLKKTIPSNFKFLLLIDIFHTFSLSGASRSRDQWHEPKKKPPWKFE